jgi:hypothetical protein
MGWLCRTRLIAQMTAIPANVRNSSASIVLKS